ncbi:MAG: response regulator transcription factor [Spirochaetes bacterium]|nr:response regulator transcription factor [Spirochaetota bacterium]
MENKIIRILVVDDHSIIRDGIQQIINRSDEMRICATAADADGAVKSLNENEIDLSIVDINLKGTVSGIDLIKSMRERFPSVKILVLSMHDESIYGERSIKAGADGYIMKEVASLYLLEAIRSIMNGELYISNGLQKQIIGKLARGNSGTGDLGVESLTDREFEVFQLVGNGFSAKEIAGRLHIAMNTVDSHRNRIKEKLKLESSSDLVKYAIQWVISKSRLQN